MKKYSGMISFKLFFFAFFIFIIFILSFLYIGNNKIEISYLDFYHKLANNNIKILHLSDLHGKQFGHNNNILFDCIKKEAPDLIFITGDIANFDIDSFKATKLLDQKKEKIYNDNLLYTQHILNNITPIAPTFVSLGNHEHVFEKFHHGFKNFKDIVEDSGAHLLINQLITLNIKNTTINILGTDNYLYQELRVNDLVESLENKPGIKIILDHYPANFALNRQFSYINYNIDYVFSGHEHGGQIRLPLIGGLFSHKEGLFPKYCSGTHLRNGVTLIISRGLGNSILPIRLFNRPEIIVASIKNG